MKIYPIGYCSHGVECFHCGQCRKSTRQNEKVISISQTSNSFGDQIIEAWVQTDQGTELITRTNAEGSWESLEQVKKQLNK